MIKRKNVFIEKSNRDVFIESGINEFGKITVRLFENSFSYQAAVNGFADIEIYSDEKEATLVDIQMPKDDRTINKGYGSIVWLEIENILKEKSVKEIKGRMHPEGETQEEKDKHLERQKSFYTKYDFNIDGMEITKTYK